LEKKRSVDDDKKWIEKLMWAKQTSDARGPSKKKREKEEKKRGGLMTTPFFFPPLFDECI
jgi:hypothetical protein